MDLKSLARSKRAHTQHHQPRKPRHLKSGTTPTASASSSSQDPAIAKKEAKERKRVSGDSSLPSNWDRYVDPEDEDGGGELSADQTAIAKTDVVKPKSKGADFSFLISQAKSRPPACSSVSLDDVLPDNCRGLGSMLSVRGQNLVSWTGGADSIFEEDESTSNTEAPFLSLDLKMISEELSKIDLAKRLFIDPELLPPELRGTPKTEESNSPMLHGTTHREQKDEDVAHISTSSSTQNPPVKERPLNLDDNIQASNDLKNTHQAPSDAIQEKVKSGQHAGGPKLNLSGISDSRQLTGTKHETDVSKGVPSFKAEVVEAELETLLNSFNETKLVNNDSFSSTTRINIQSNTEGSGNTSKLPISRGSSTSWRTQIPVMNSKGGSMYQFSSNLDEELDSLLNETSSLVNPPHAVPHSSEVNASLPLDNAPASLSSSSHPPTSKSNVIEDFDSWLDTI